jgi:hypothetical protein
MRFGIKRISSSLSSAIACKRSEGQVYPMRTVGVCEASAGLLTCDPGSWVLG